MIAFDSFFDRICTIRNFAITTADPLIFKKDSATAEHIVTGRSSHRDKVLALVPIGMIISLTILFVIGRFAPPDSKVFFFSINGLS
jgi:hypothetical protein